MFALFLALTAALGLMLWAEVSPVGWRPRAARSKAAPEDAPVPPLDPRAAERTHPSPPPATADDDAAVMARLAALLEEPEAAPAAPAATDDLPLISGYRPGDVIELELEGPAPRAEDIAFEQAGQDTRVLIEGFPALVVQRARAATLSPTIFRFRGPQLA